MQAFPGLGLDVHLLDRQEIDPEMVVNLEDVDVFLRFPQPAVLDRYWKLSPGLDMSLAALGSTRPALHRWITLLHAGCRRAMITRLRDS